MANFENSGIQRRLTVPVGPHRCLATMIPFNAKFEGNQRDLNILDKLKAEAPATLAWIIQGAINWQTNGLQIPADARTAPAKYLASNDDMAMWIEQCCERSGSATASDLYASFSKSKKNRGALVPSQTVWGSRIPDLPQIERRKSSGIRYDGIQLTLTEMRRLHPNVWRGWDGFTLSTVCAGTRCVLQGTTVPTFPNWQQGTGHE